MFGAKKRDTRKLVSGTVRRIGPFLVVSASSLTYELMLDGHTHSFRIGARHGLRPTSLIHVTRVGDAVEFEVTPAAEGQDYHIGIEDTFKNLSLAQERTSAK